MAKNDGGPAFPCGSFEPQPGRVCIMDDDYSYLNSLGDAIELLQSFDRSVSALATERDRYREALERIGLWDCRLLNRQCEGIWPTVSAMWCPSCQAREALRKGEE